MSGFIVIILSASIMIQVFSDSHIGDMTERCRGQFLKDFNIGPTAALVGTDPDHHVLNLFWHQRTDQMAPVCAGVHPAVCVHRVPAVIQMTYRIGDAITNSIRSMNASWGAIIGYYTL